MTMEIEKNIPIPTTRIKNNKHVNIARKMNVGDSIFIKAVEEDIGKYADYNRETHAIANNFANALRRLNKKATVRISRDDDGTLLGFRVWRTE